MFPVSKIKILLTINKKNIKFVFDNIINLFQSEY